METSKSIIVFDGYCNLCDGVVNFLIKHDRKKQFNFIPMQSEIARELAQHYLIPEHTDAVILITPEKYFLASDAALEIMHKLPFPWKMAVVFRHIPKPLRDGIYDYVASKRYRWWGRRNECHVAHIQ